MSKKIMVLLLLFSLLQPSGAHAGFFDFFKAFGLAISNLFNSAPPRATESELNSTVSFSDSDWAPSPALAEDPNNYQASVKVDPEPEKAECNPQTMTHRCSYIESSQAVANSCVNPVAVKSGYTGGNSSGKSTN